MAAKHKRLSDWLEYIESIHPDSIEFGLERVNSVFLKLFPEGLPFPVITVAGTNGKGSCCAYIEAIMQESGLKSGKYTSPHLVLFNERVVVNAEMVNDELLSMAFDKIEAVRKNTILTYFEYTTLAAMIVFADQKVDIGIFEVGLGGRLDAVNILEPIVSVITSIGIDHVDWLGDDREKIGLEKAAIARRGRHCVVGELDVPESVMQYLEEINALTSYVGVDLKVIHEADSWAITHDGVSIINSIPVLHSNAAHQYQNATCAAFAAMNAHVDVSVSSIARGLSSVAVEGRCQLLSKQPLIVLDVAHNEDSVLALREYIRTLSFDGRCYAVFSMLRDKDLYTCVESMFDLIDEWNIAPIDSDRGSSIESIESAIHDVASSKGQGFSVNSYASIKDAYDRVKNSVKSDDCVIVFGSFHVVGDILSIN